MSKHDYSQNTVAGISEEISRNKSVIADSVLSTENMQYSWASGIVNNVVTWFEVKQINRMKAELEFILTRADSKLENVSGIIETTDYTASASLNNQVSNLISVSGKADALLNTLTGYGAVKEVHGWKPEEEAVVYDISDYIYYDSEKKSYYIKNQKKLRNLLNNENLSDKDKKIIYKILTLMVDDNGNINTK
ncbi:MAG: hypothetical protein K2J36_08805, partial [Ruminococcus sp.]|nr:hypothetical protein [Ruminococcus sp.]